MGANPANEATYFVREYAWVAGSTFCAVPVLPAEEYPSRTAFFPVPSSTTPLHHLLHLRRGHRRNDAPPIGGMKRNCLRRGLRIGRRSDNSGRHRRRHRSRSSKPMTPTASARFRSPGPWRLRRSKLSTTGSPAWSNREFRRAIRSRFADRSQMRECIYKIGLRPRRSAILMAPTSLDSARIPADRQQPVRLAVANTHAVDDDRSHLAIEHFVRTS